MSVTLLSEQVWEILFSYLEPHHLGRFYLIGNRAFSNIVGLAHRTMDFKKLPCSPLIISVLIPNTVHAIISADQLSGMVKTDSISNSRLKTLKCVYSYYREGQVDFSGANKLEALEITSFVNTLVLPASLMSLSLTCNYVSCISNFADLVNLTNLSLRLEVRGLKQFGNNIEWPSRLETLELQVSCLSVRDSKEFGDCLSRLPSTLLSLSFNRSIFNDDTFNIFPPVPCDQLVSIEIGGRCAYKNDNLSFPSSLRRLVIDELELSREVLNALFSSGIIHIYVKRIHVSCSTAEEVQLFYLLSDLLHRMDRVSVINLIVHIVARIDSKRISDTCTEALKCVGLTFSYFDLIRYLVDDGGQISQEKLCELQHCSYISDFIADDIIHKLLGWKCRRSGTFISRWALSIGFFEWVYLSDMASIDVVSMHRNVKKLRIDDIADGGSMIEELSRHNNDLSHIEEIMVSLRTDDWHSVVLVIFEIKNCLRGLNRISFLQVRTKSPIFGDDDITLLAEMHFFPKRQGSSIFNYRVAPPIARHASN